MLLNSTVLNSVIILKEITGTKIKLFKVKLTESYFVNMKVYWNMNSWADIPVVTLSDMWLEK
jgi:hypothetical protein